MIRNLKVLFAAAMVLGALGAVGASGAQAAEFHCASAPCKLGLQPDRVVGSKTAHHVFIVTNSIGESVSFTCDEIVGSATSESKTFTTATVTGLAYNGCRLATDATKTVKVTTNGCDYTITSHGKVGVTCPEGKSIEVEIVALGCIMKIGTFPDLSGIGFHVLNSTPNREVTVEALVKEIPVTTTGTKAQCLIDTTKTPLKGDYTTGNTIATAETDPGGTMIDGWWE
jgi:hypothetical protein